MENQKVARVFQEIGDILQLQGVNRFRYLAYYKAVQIVESLSLDVRKIYDDPEKQFTDIPGIGSALASKIVEILETGQCKEHQELLNGFSKGLLELLTIRGLGPKKVKLFYDVLGIDDIHKLKAAAEKGSLAELPRMGEKSQAEILKAIIDHEKHRERIILHSARVTADAMVEYMKTCEEVTKVQFAGSLRRGRETIGDVDILATGKDHAKIIQHFIDHSDVQDVLAHGETKASVVNGSGFQIDFRVVEAKSFGSALYYFTGSKNHNIHARKLAIGKGMKVNEYGIFKGDEWLAGETESDIFKVLGLPYIIPELREDNGEIEAGFNDALPDSIEVDDIRGDLHMHTTASDGKNSLEEMVGEAKKLGYEYIAITDHSPSVRVAHGLSNERVLDHIARIDALNEKIDGMTILKGAEIDILADGSLDYPDEILAKLDMVNISVHSKFNLPADEQTARVIKGLSNPYVTMLCHPTGRIVKQREPILIDIVEVARAAKAHGVAMEINGSSRLDLSPGNAKLAKEQGCKFLINTDSHRVMHLQNMRFGVTLARRGWIEKTDVLNTLPLAQMLSYFNRPQ
jgi:DNA polymerase (family X)